jgi:hypothetical protein
VGKRYRTRDGEEVIKIVLFPSALMTFPFQGDDECLYRENGSIGYCKDDFDLVEETDELSDAEKRNIGEEILTGIQEIKEHKQGERSLKTVTIDIPDKLFQGLEDAKAGRLVDRGTFHTTDDAYEFLRGRKVNERVVLDTTLQDIQNSAFTGGVKHDDGKPMFACLQPDALLELGKVAALGANKYGLHNYRKGLSVSRTIDAAFRHLIAFLKGEDNDPVDGNNHLASVAWNALTALQTLKDHPELDDRYKGDK